MRVIFKDDVIVFVPETDAERDDVTGYARSRAGYVFELRAAPGALTLRNLGAKADACREPINIGSRAPTVEWRAISNFAHSPFELDGRRYASVEGFWQSLKFEGDDDRARVAALYGYDAKKAANGIAGLQMVAYDGAVIGYASREHWALMRRACTAKFTQDRTARAALLSTGTRPLEHRMRNDSRSIPGVVMSEIWMEVRAELACDD